VGFIVHVSWLFLGMRGGRGEDWQLEYLCREEGLRDWERGDWEVLGTGVKMMFGLEGDTESEFILGYRERKVWGCMDLEGIKIRDID
jgi:hypothetical protein